MGNYGNTLDRWYHRAAVIVWPGDRAFANRAEISPAWALDELVAMTSAGDASGAQAAAATLASFWNGVVRARTADERGGVAGLIGKALTVADDVADAETAAMLLHPFSVENLTAAHAGPLGKIAGRYGQQWTTTLLQTWFGGDQPSWAYGAGLDRPQWVADQLPGLCAGLHATGNAGVVAALRLLDLAWQWARTEIRTALAAPSPSYRDKSLTGLGKPLAAVLTAAAAIEAASTRDTASRYVRKLEDAVTALEISTLRAAKRPRDRMRGDAGFGELAADCAARLRVRLAGPQRALGDWSIELPAGGCACDLCDTLRAFLSDKSRRTFARPLAK
jgi:hypothetical protein